MSPPPRLSLFLTLSYKHIYVLCVYIYIHPTPLHEQGTAQDQFLNRVQQVWLKSPVRPTTLFIDGGTIDGYIPFPILLAIFEM